MNTARCIAWPDHIVTKVHEEADLLLDLPNSRFVITNVHQPSRSPRTSNAATSG